MASAAPEVTRRLTTDEFLEDAGLLAQVQHAQDAGGVISALPVTVCGFALGFMALGHVWLTAANLLLPGVDWFHHLAVVIAIVTGIVATCLLVLYIVKIFLMGPSKFFDHLWESPNDVCRLATGTMAMMLLSFTLSHYLGLFWLAAAVWVVALVAHVGIVCVFITQVLQMGNDTDDMNAAWVLPTVGICVATGAGLSCGIGEWVEVFFWLALLSSGFFFPLVLYRLYVKGPALPDGMLATNIILLAPPALLFIQYLSIGGHRWELLPFTYVLYFLTLLLALGAAFSFPAIFSAEFNLLAVDMTYPLAFAAKATLLFWFGYMSDDRYLSLPFLLPALLLLLLASAALLFVCVRVGIIVFTWHQDGSLPATQKGITARRGPSPRSPRRGRGGEDPGYQIPRTTDGSVEI